MKLVSYPSDGEWRAGAVLGSTVYDVDVALIGSGMPGLAPRATTRELLRRHGGALEQVEAAVRRAAAELPHARVGDMSDLRLGPPIDDPGKVLCIGLNYQDHVAETGRALPAHPDVFAKFASTLIGPRDEIRCSYVTDSLDFEGELAVVIGREGRDVEPSAALDLAAGLMVLNDITARDLQYRGTQWLAGKAVDGSTPCGPAVVTLDEVGDPQNLELATWVNGVRVQGSNTKHMIFSVAELISYVSRFLTLSPGDIISTGTPEGIGSKRNPPLWLKPGDTVDVEIERVGRLRNVVR
ncbi:FAA hydrolase family protein [Streptomyces sp. SID8361]|uniref:fumarylacetoacetate hydrolase family protein n=1 Tax=Streptomyces TaxID=1883 RepID=UPI00081F3698|nr:MULTISPECIES: fumarylacetoacetate hydrolase family protein [unclassified Streptomyces]AUA16494.1 Ureidoglycolate lyase [Streptomyces sp. M56]MYU10221.1 FAA hydrolase family protein [Streptomyces sp. SID8361]MYX57358.1 FAA hydrolase family protein [Streptomyces sp. SID8382]SCF69592.1 2-keto-4-pentenoate hydratase/2-oxohepta-3-ene-1,7-dioic acid hydratase (catechol pathway) [Streptomyces sp. MnatMP-M27]